MLKKVAIFASAVLCAVSGAAKAAETEESLARITWTLEVSAHICKVNNRNICILKSATYALNNPELLEHMQRNYPGKVDWFEDLFVRSSFSASQSGRSFFKKVLVDNALETLNFFHLEFKNQANERYDPTELDGHKAVFNLIRAEYCDEEGDDACTIEALGVVKKAMDAGIWGEMSDIYRIEEPYASVLPSQLLSQYGDRL